MLYPRRAVGFGRIPKEVASTKTVEYRTISGRVVDRLRENVITCSVTFQLRPQTVPDSEQPSEKRGLNCEELRDRYTGPPRGTVKELVYPYPEGHGKMRGSRPSHMLENTLFRGVLSNPLAE